MKIPMEICIEDQYRTTEGGNGAKWQQEGLPATEDLTMTGHHKTLVNANLKESNC